MVELESQGALPRAEVAAFLRQFAEEIDDRGVDRDRTVVDAEATEAAHPADSADAKRLTFIVGGDSATVTVPETVNFDVEVVSRSPMFSSTVSQQIELELSWKLDAADERRDEDRVEIG